MNELPIYNWFYDYFIRSCTFTVSYWPPIVLIIVDPLYFFADIPPFKVMYFIDITHLFRGY